MVGTWRWTGKVILGISGLVWPLSLSIGKLLLYPRCLWWIVNHWTSFLAISVYSGYCNKRAQNWVAYKQQKFFSHSSEAGESEIRVPAQWDYRLLAADWLLLVLTQWRAKRKLSCDSESTNPNHEGSTPMTSPNPNYLPKAHLLAVSDRGRVSTHGFWKDMNVQPIT